MVFSPPLSFRHTKPGQAIKPGTTLRILGVGDSITVGYLSDIDGGDGNGYRLKLRDDLSKDHVVFSGTETMGGTMPGGYFAAWSGMTIQFISEHVGPSLQQRPNIVLIHAGTNDMNPNLDVAKEGNDPEGAVDRLGKLIDKITEGCPDATVLVGIIIGCHDEMQMGNIAHFQSLIPGVVQTRRDAGKHVLAVDFSTFPMDALRDGLHPTNSGYRLMGDYWYDFIAQIPTNWIQQPIGDDPRRSGEPGRTKPIEVGSVNWGQRLLGLVFGKTA
ncbi:GDSL-like Lipase/Acylhydrolase [Colletotrichum cereale]|nr:GDSL-like Lipase/Acylhydrolase [Colletotrichum cereale]